MLNARITKGALFYGRTKRRLDVDFDDSLRKETKDTIALVHEFIKKVEVLDKKQDSEEVKKELVKIEEELAKEEIKERLLDYEQNFESELSDDRRKNIENFAKEIPRGIDKQNQDELKFEAKKNSENRSL